MEGKEKISGSIWAITRAVWPAGERLRWKRWKDLRSLPKSGDVRGRETVCDEAFYFVPKKRRGKEQGSWSISEGTTAFSRTLTANILFSANITIKIITFLLFLLIITIIY